MTEWDAQSGILAGRREDLVDYGDGLSDPLAGVIQADPPLEDLYPNPFTTEVSSSATELRQNLGSFNTPNGFIFGARRQFTLEDPQSDFADVLKAQSYADFSEMQNFQSRLRGDLGAGPLYDNRAYWSRGPMTWKVGADPMLPGTTRVLNAFHSPFVADLGGSTQLEHFPGGVLRYVELGSGNESGAGAPPQNGAPARLSVALNAVTSATDPPKQAGSVTIYGQSVFPPFTWQMDLTKVNMQTGQGLVQRYGVRLGAPPVTFTQFDLSQQALPGAILEPPAAEQVTFYGLNRFQQAGGFTSNIFYYSRILIPPYTQQS